MKHLVLSLLLLCAAPALADEPQTLRVVPAKPAKSKELKRVLEQLEARLRQAGVEAKLSLRRGGVEVLPPAHLQGSGLELLKTLLTTGGKVELRLRPEERLLEAPADPKKKAPDGYEWRQPHPAGPYARAGKPLLVATSEAMSRGSFILQFGPEDFSWGFDRAQIPAYAALADKHPGKKLSILIDGEVFTDAPLETDRTYGFLYSVPVRDREGWTAALEIAIAHPLALPMVLEQPKESAPVAPPPAQKED